MSEPLFSVSKSGISIVDVDACLELGCKRFEKKNIFVATWTLELGVLKVFEFPTTLFHLPKPTSFSLSPSLCVCVC
jgi:hypothetical protein